MEPPRPAFCPGGWFCVNPASFPQEHASRTIDNTFQVPITGDRMDKALMDHRIMMSICHVVTGIQIGGGVISKHEQTTKSKSATNGHPRPWPLFDGNCRFADRQW
jgi:hypothetical protein